LICVNKATHSIQVKCIYMYLLSNDDEDLKLDCWMLLGDFLPNLRANELFLPLKVSRGNKICAHLRNSQSRHMALCFQTVKDM